MKRLAIGLSVLLAAPAPAQTIGAPAPPLLGSDWMDPPTALDQRIDPVPEPRGDQRSAGLDDMIAGTRLLHDGGRAFTSRIGRRLDRIDGGYLVVPVWTLKL